MLSSPMTVAACPFTDSVFAMASVRLPALKAVVASVHDDVTVANR